MNTEVVWQGNMEFVNPLENGQKIVMSPSAEGNVGISPMKLLLTGLAGCTGIDIISILEKMRFQVDSFKIMVEGQRAEDYPKRYTEINVKYILKGEGLSASKVDRAIKLSLEKYCSVSNSLNADIKYSFEIE